MSSLVPPRQFLKREAHSQELLSQLQEKNKDVYSTKTPPLGPSQQNQRIKCDDTMTKIKYRYFIIIQECQSEFYAIKYITPERTAWGLGNSISNWVCAQGIRD